MNCDTQYTFRLRTLSGENKLSSHGETIDLVEQVMHNDVLFALIIRSNFTTDGIKFFTPSEFSQQLAYMRRPAHWRIDPHVHNLVPRHVDYTNEVLLIKSGKVRVDFYESAETYIESRLLFPGDVILLARGGHGFTMLEESEMVEVKQGPYAGDADKTRFSGVAEAAVRIRGRRRDPRQ